MVDANILVRAVLGRRVRQVFEQYAGKATFFVPEVAYREAEEHLAALVVKRSDDPKKAVTFLRSLRDLVELIGNEVYGDFEAEARERLAGRDLEDWPVLASALALGCRSGPRIPTSSDVVSPPGLPVACGCSCGGDGP